jgi:hypothetical protein
MPRSAKAKTPAQKRQWDHVEQSMLDRGASPKRAAMAANAVVRDHPSKKRSKGYADGGEVDPFRQGFPPADPGERRNRLADIDRMMKKEAADRKKDPDPTGFKKGGAVRKVTGKPIGRDDGLIAAQRGEYVVKRASVQKYGEPKMAAVNAGTAKITTRRKSK